MRKWMILLAAVLMLLGIGILSLDGESGGLNRGDVLTLVCGVLYAARLSPSGAAMNAWILMR